MTTELNRRAWLHYVSAVFLSFLFVTLSVLISSGALFGNLLAPQAQAATGSVNVWWPVANFPVSGTQPFKAMVEGMNVESYEMFWQVDNGQLNGMHNSYQDYPHKEASVDVSGWSWRGSGPYMVNFVVKQNGNIIAQRSVELRLNSSQPAPIISAPAPQPAPAPQQTSAPSPILFLLAPAAKAETITPTPAVTTNNTFFVESNTPAAKQASDWRASRGADAAKMDILAAQPTAKWLGAWNADILNDVKKVANAAATQNKTAVYVAYNIPQRDCGGYSAGGTSREAYGSWIQSIAQGIGSTKAIVILEPDALAGITCLSAGDQQARLDLISAAITTLKKNSNTKVYLDGGHSGWLSASDMAGRLQKASISKADGFFLNISNFRRTSDETTYGTEISKLVNNKHFVIDTSRNGQGPNGTEWCNPAGRGLGAKPTAATGNALVDAYLWVKTPGESDGACNGAPNAGVWWPEYALGLVERAQQ